MFGLVCVSEKELTEQQRARYSAMYCGICRRLRQNTSALSGLCLSFDVVFLAMLLGSLYEPEESGGDRACMLHPIKPHAWLDSPYIAYAADMNAALAYYNCLDDWQDDGKRTAKIMASELEKYMPGIRQRWPRQCDAIEHCIERIRALEKENCGNPDAPAESFGTMMEELLVYRADNWEGYLRSMGNALGRFIYLCDAAMDRRKDQKCGNYNPFLAMAQQPEQEKIESWLMMTMGNCTQSYEMLPLVQDKEILDNILYSGIWLQYGRKRAVEK